MREVVLARPGDFAEWRDAARGLLAGGVAPEDISWRGAEEGASLFGNDAPPISGAAVSLPRELLVMADRAICHRDSAVPARLYRIVWRVARDRQLLARRTDPDIDWLGMTDKAIRRDIHKMHAFVRFRRLGEEAGRERFAGWFEPDHYIIRLTAPFFQRRFYGMDWAIVTPDARAIWHDETLTYGPGGTKDEVPDSDIVEDQWRTYYGAIFNPARVKIDAMRAEMPKKYWKNLPEAQDIAPLLAGAAARVERMRETAVSLANPQTDKWRTRVPEALGPDRRHRHAGRPRPRSRRLHSLPAPLQRDASGGRRRPGGGRASCWSASSRAIARIWRGGRFVGPAGQVLNEALEEAGLDRQRLFLTNAVKHFKFEPRGKRRLHQNPTTGEIDICRWWLDKERSLVQPDLIVTLGRQRAARGDGGKA